MSRCKVAGLAAVVGFVPALAACGTTGSTTQGVKAPTAKSASALHGTLTFFDWGLFSGPKGSGGPADYRQIIAPYEHMHPGVKVKLVEPPASAANWILWEDTDLTSGHAPSIISPAVALQPWPDVSRGWYLRLNKLMNAPDPYAPGHVPMKDLISGLERRELKFNGGYYSVEFLAQDAGIWYDKAAFTKAGIATTPTTWQQFQVDMGKLKAAGFIPFGFDGGDTTYGDPIPSIMAALESLTMQPEFNRMTGNKTGIVTPQELVKAVKAGVFSSKDPNFVEAWTLLKQWSRYFQPGAAGAGTTTANSSQTAFIRGKVAMYFAGPYVMPTLNSSHLPFSYGVFPIPQLTKATWPAVTAQHQGVGLWSDWGTNPMAITSSAVKSKSVPLAENFLQYLATPKNQKTMAANHGFLPALPGNPVVGPPAVAKRLAVIRKIVRDPSRVSQAETVVLGAAGETSQVRVMENLLDGHSTVAQAVSAAQSVYQRAARSAGSWLKG